MVASSRAAVVRHELIGLGGVVERNWYLVKRYFLVGARVLPLDGREHADDRLHREGRRGAGGAIENELTTMLLIGAVDLGVPRDHLRDPHRDGRVGALGGDDRVHVHGAALAAGAPVRDGRLRGRSTGSSARRSCSWSSPRSSALALPDANFAAALVLLAIASISFIGIGMMTAVLPLISPEKGTQLGFIAQGMMLVVSGVYYPV